MTPGDLDEFIMLFSDFLPIVLGKIAIEMGKIKGKSVERQNNSKPIFILKCIFKTKV